MGATRHNNTKRSRIRAAKRKDSHANVKKLASCDGKIRYEKYQRTEALAKYPEGRVKFYKCQFCRWYHIGRAPRGGKYGR